VSVLGRNWMPNSLPWLAARNARRCALMVVKIWDDIGSPKGRPNFTELMKVARPSATSPAAATGMDHLLFSGPRRPDARKAATSNAPITQAYPVVSLLRLVATTSATASA